MRSQSVDPNRSRQELPRKEAGEPRKPKQDPREAKKQPRYEPITDSKKPKPQEGGAKKALKSKPQAKVVMVYRPKAQQAKTEEEEADELLRKTVPTQLDSSKESTASKRADPPSAQPIQPPPNQYAAAVNLFSNLTVEQTQQIYQQVL